VVKNSLWETNFQISQLSLSLLQHTIKLNTSTHKIPRTNDMLSDLDKIIQEVVKRLSDNNAKLKSSAEETFNHMIRSSLYGVEVCCNVLMNVKGPKLKLSNKQEVERLRELGKIVGEFGFGAPYSVIDYGVAKLDNASGEVRGEAMHLLGISAKV
jgi:hypothetical protein